MTVGGLVTQYIDEVVEVPDANIGRTKRNTLKMLEKLYAYWGTMKRQL